MNVVFMKVIVELAFTCKIYEACKGQINYKLILREPSLMNTTLRSFNEECYLVFRVNFCDMGICSTRLKFVYKISKQQTRCNSICMFLLPETAHHFENRSTIYSYLAQSPGCRYGFMRDA